MGAPERFSEILRAAIERGGLVPYTKNEQSSQQKELTAKALKALSTLGSATVQEDAVQFRGTQIVLPEQFSGKLGEAAKFLQDLERQESTLYSFSRIFKCRPWDGAAAFQRALMRVFGTAGLGKVTPGGFFSPDEPPRLISINTGVSTQLQVPWGEIIMPPLNATFLLAAHRDREKGLLFNLHVTAPRNMRTQLEGFFDVVQNELDTRSIYRGQAFDGAEEPNFIDITRVNPEEVIYTEEVMAQLNANIWALLRYTEAMIKNNMPLKRSVLLEGPWGTGKSLAGVLTAQIAALHGWTFIQVRPGIDDLPATLKTAELYQPCVVQVEDIDTLMSDNPDDNSAFLDALDGIGNKGAAVVLIATTNHMEKIRRAVMRPGRIDSVIRIADLDAPAVERLVRVTLPADALGDIEWPRLHEAFAGFLPAFITEACRRAVRYAMVRNEGVVGPITTDDLAHAATGLRPQLEAMMGAAVAAAPAPTIDRAFTELIKDAARSGVDGMKTVDYDGDLTGKLVAAES